MNSWIIVGIVLLFLFLLLQLRIGAVLEYGQDNLQLEIRVGPGHIKIYPKLKPQKVSDKKKKQKANSNSAGKMSSESGKKKGRRLSLDQLTDLAQRFIPLALEAAGCLWNKLIMDDLEISVTAGSHDPADSAMLYGQIHSGLAALWGPMNQAFHVKNGRAHVEIDFESNSIMLYVKTAISIKIGQVLWIALYFGVKALKQLLRYRKAQKTEAQERKAV